MAQHTFVLKSLQVEGVEICLAILERADRELRDNGLACYQEDGVPASPVRWRIYAAIDDTCDPPESGFMQAVTYAGREFSGPVKRTNLSEWPLIDRTISRRVQYQGTGRLNGLRPGDLSGW